MTRGLQTSLRRLTLVGLTLALCACSQPQDVAQPPLVEQEPAKVTEPGETPLVATTAPQLDFSQVTPADLAERAPDVFITQFDTTEGTFRAEFHRAWSPNGVDRFYNLVRGGYYQDIAAFRVIAGFMAQFGIHGNPAVNEVMREAKILDDPPQPTVSNVPGAITFAMAGPNTRTVQLFINFANNARLDGQGFRPIGKVLPPGMDIVRRWHTGYGEGAPGGLGPDQGRTQGEGNDYLRAEFPELSYIRAITLLE